MTATLLQALTGDMGCGLTTIPPLFGMLQQACAPGAEMLSTSCPNIDWCKKRCIKALQEKQSQLFGQPGTPGFSSIKMPKRVVFSLLFFLFLSSLSVAALTWKGRGRQGDGLQPSSSPGLARGQLLEHPVQRSHAPVQCARPSSSRPHVVSLQQYHSDSFLHGFVT